MRLPYDTIEALYELERAERLFRSPETATKDDIDWLLDDMSLELDDEDDYELEDYDDDDV